jgi:chromosomal replication initiation ATPase DnaA
VDQLALDLGLPASPPETVISRANEAAYALLAEWPRWPHPWAIVTGPRGSGKSHLARAFAERTGGRVVPGLALVAEDPVALAAAGPVAVDDAGMADERALFHLLNAARAAGSHVLLTAVRRPLPALPDLGSRLRAAPEVALGAPDDALLKRVLIDSFLARQLPADPSVVAFALSRMERTLHAATAFVEAMDRLGLEERRRPTRVLAARLLRPVGSD